VPVSRLRLDGPPAFSFDAVTCYMQVFTPKGSHPHGAAAAKPMLGVYDVFEVLSGDLSLPYTVQRR
jgi:hypothetical protein